MYDRTSKRWANPAIAKAAQEPDYYPAETEQRLAREVEAPANLVLDALRQGRTIHADQREALTFYLAVMLMRGPQKRRRSNELAPKVLGNVLAELKEELAQHRSSETNRRIDELFREMDEIDAKYRHQMPHHIRSLIEDPWPSDTVVSTIREMTWRVIDVPRWEWLLTTDTPFHYFHSLGLGNPESEFTFAISTDRAIIGSWQGPPRTTQYHTGKAKVVKEINRRLIDTAERFIFSPKQAAWIQNVADRDLLRLNRINWI